jgi:hypothetical protein
MMQPVGSTSGSREVQEQRTRLPPPELPPLAASPGERPALRLPAGSSQQQLEPETPGSTPVAMSAGGSCSPPALLPQHCSYRGLVGRCAQSVPACRKLCVHWPTASPAHPRCRHQKQPQHPACAFPRCSGEGGREVACHCEAQGHTRGHCQVCGPGGRAGTACPGVPVAMPIGGGGKRNASLAASQCSAPLRASASTAGSLPLPAPLKPLPAAAWPA